MKVYFSQLSSTFLIVAALASLPAASGAEPVRRTVLVMLQNRAGAPSALVERAQVEVIRLYDLIGIEVVWVTEVPDPARRLRVVCLTTHDDRRPHEVKTANSVLGYTLLPHGGRGILAYVFWWRVERASQKFTTSLDKVLAIAIAHELGHMLLPDGKHTEAGLMAAPWDASHFRSAAVGVLAFSTESAGLIRQEAEKEGLATVAASSSTR